MSQNLLTQERAETFGQTVTQRRSRSKTRVKDVILYLLLITLSILYLLPLYWMISTSLKQTGSEMVIPPQWAPNPIVWQNYVDVFVQVPLTLYIRNSLVITLTATLFGVLTASLAGYGFARVQFPGRNFLFTLCIASLMLPETVTLIPEFILFRRIGWVNTFLPLIIPWSLAGSAFAVFLFRQYCLTIPLELDEAARVDGAGTLRIWWMIIVPLSKAVLATLAILSFIHHWNEFLRPLIYLGRPELRTLALGLRAFRGEYQLAWNYMMAVALIMLVPILILFFVAQRQFVQGIVMTGIKG
ncbi:MAG: carbohydrate ABC transporter permease [Caldilinea sp. CFX5]|nr:carbohydrate ABC transporter permease [Caldilinea sp. CFX5]